MGADQEMTDMTNNDLEYHVRPQNDPVRALNILRDAAGLEPLSDDTDDRRVPDPPRHQ